MYELVELPGGSVDEKSLRGDLGTRNDQERGHEKGRKGQTYEIIDEENSGLEEREICVKKQCVAFSVEMQKSRPGEYWMKIFRGWQHKDGL